MRATWQRVTAGVLAFCISGMGWAPMASAETPSSRPNTRLTLAAAAEAKAAALALDPAAAAPAQDATTASASDSKGFFKSRKGILAVVLMAAGVGYTFYSKDKDRVRSPIR